LIERDSTLARKASNSAKTVPRAVGGQSAVELAHQLAHGSLLITRFGLRLAEFWLHNRKRPGGEPGRFWGYYREESYVSL
jgi:hypothetical protein